MLRLIRKWIIPGLLGVIVGAIGWHLAACLLDQRSAVATARDQWSKVRASTQKYFDEQDAFYDRTLTFLANVHSGRRTVDSIEADKQQVISGIAVLIQECNEVRAARYDFGNRWNHMESMFLISSTPFPDIGGQCTHWPLFAEELRSTDSASLVADRRYEADFYSNRKQVAQSKTMLAGLREEERKQAQRVDMIVKEADGRAIAGNCWTCTKIALRLER